MDTVVDTIVRRAVDTIDGMIVDRRPRDQLCPPRGQFLARWFWRRLRRRSIGRR
jgi:hypothetical protein